MDTRLDSALIALRQILRATEINSRALAKATGLSTSQHIVLQVLADRSGLTQSALGAEVSLSHATVTTLLGRLEQRGLVQRARDAKDKRKVLLEITPTGRATLDAAPSPLQSRFEASFLALEPWEQAFLLTALERTVTMLDASELDAAPVLDVGAIATPNS